MLFKNGDRKRRFVQFQPVITLLSVSIERVNDADEILTIFIEQYQTYKLIVQNVFTQLDDISQPLFMIITGTSLSQQAVTDAENFPAQVLLFQQKAEITGQEAQFISRA